MGVSQSLKGYWKLVSTNLRIKNAPASSGSVVLQRGNQPSAKEEPKPRKFPVTDKWRAPCCAEGIATICLVIALALYIERSVSIRSTKFSPAMTKSISSGSGQYTDIHSLPEMISYALNVDLNQVNNYYSQLGITNTYIMVSFSSVLPSVPRRRLSGSPPPSRVYRFGPGHRRDRSGWLRVRSPVQPPITQR